MPKQIQVENEIIEFPDNMPDNEIEAVIKREFYNQPQQPKQNQVLQQQQRQQRERQQIANEEGRIGSLATTATNILPGMARAKALTAALSAKAMGGDETIGNFYDEALRNELTKLSIAREKYPIQSIASELLGGAGVGGKILKSVGLGGNNLKSVLGGGGLLGASYAAGETPDLTSKQAIKDTATGGALGVAGGAVIKGVGAVGNVIGKTAKTIKNTINPSAEKVLSKIISPEEANQQARKLTNKIEQGRITALPEQNNENILGLTKLLGKTKGSDKIIGDYIIKKSTNSAKRINDLLNNNLSAESYFNKLDDIIARRKELSSPLYEQARIEGEQNLQEFLKTKKVKVSEPILDKEGKQIRDLGTGIYLTRIVEVDAPAKKLYDNPNITKYVNAAKNEPLFVDPRLSNNSFEVLVGAKKMIDKDISAAKNIRDKESVSALMGVKRQVLDILEKASPTYKQANKLFAGESALLNAQEQGKKIGKLNDKEVKRYFSSLSDGEKETYKIGVKDYLMDKINKSSDKNPAKSIFGNELERNKLKVIFNNPKEFTNFSKRLNDEIRVFDTKQKIVGGSKTNFNLEEGNQVLDKIATNAINYKTLGVYNVLLMTKNAIKNKYYGLNENVAKELAQILIDPKKSVEELNKIANKSKTTIEKNLIKKFANDYLKSKNITNATSIIAGKLSAQQQEE